MAQAGPEAGEGRRLSREDLEAAVALLSAEAATRSLDWPKLLLGVLLYTALGAALNTFFLGVVVVWFVRPLGWNLLGAGVAGVVILGLLSQLWPFLKNLFSLGEVTRALRSELQRSEVGRASTGTWERMKSRGNTVLGLVVMVLFPAGLGGLGWLLYGLVTNQEAGWPAMLLTGLPGVFLFSVTSLSLVREYLHLHQVWILEAKFRVFLEQAEAPGEAAPVVSSQNIQLLSQIEIKQYSQQAAKVAAELPEAVGDLYSVAVEPAVLGFLEEFSEDQWPDLLSIRSAIDSLQDMHLPPQVNPAPGEIPTYVLLVDGYSVVYQVDEAKQKVTVTAVRPPSQEEGHHAS